MKLQNKTKEGLECHGIVSHNNGLDVDAFSYCSTRTVDGQVSKNASIFHVEVCQCSAKNKETPCRSGVKRVHVPGTWYDDDDDADEFSCVSLIDVVCSSRTA